jgi:hypothetical protein
MKFKRTKEYQSKLLIEGLDDKKVYQDADIIIKKDWNKAGKLRAYCSQVNSYLQFPGFLRIYNKKYIADIVEVIPKNRQRFFRVMKNSIRDIGSNELSG